MSERAKRCYITAARRKKLGEGSARQTEKNGSAADLKVGLAVIKRLTEFISIPTDARYVQQTK